MQDARYRLSCQSGHSDRRCPTPHSPERRRARAETAAAKGGRGSGSRARSRRPAPFSFTARGRQRRAGSGGAARPKWRREARPERAARERACAAAQPGSFESPARGWAEPAVSSGTAGSSPARAFPRGAAAWFPLLRELGFICLFGCLLVVGSLLPLHVAGVIDLKCHSIFEKRAHGSPKFPELPEEDSGFSYSFLWAKRTSLGWRKYILTECKVLPYLFLHVRQILFFFFSRGLEVVLLFYLIWGYFTKSVSWGGHKKKTWYEVYSWKYQHDGMSVTAL